MVEVRTEPAPQAEGVLSPVEIDRLIPHYARARIERAFGQFLTPKPDPEFVFVSKEKFWGEEIVRMVEAGDISNIFQAGRMRPDDKIVGVCDHKERRLFIIESAAANLKKIAAIDQLLQYYSRHIVESPIAGAEAVKQGLKFYHYTADREDFVVEGAPFDEMINQAFLAAVDGENYNTLVASRVISAETATRRDRGKNLVETIGMEIVCLSFFSQSFMPLFRRISSLRDAGEISQSTADEWFKTLRSSERISVHFRPGV